MPTPAQAYLNLSANMGRGSTASGVSSDQGAEKFINNSATAGALGATAVFPAVVNNMSYADDYVNLTKTVNKVGQAGAVYSSYKTALGLAGPQGSEQMGNTFSPGNLMRARVETASYLNPVTGVLNAVNSMTKNEKNPQGTLPGVSYVQGKVDQFGNALNNTKVGNFMSNTAQAFHENFISPVLQTRPGQMLTSVAGIPMGAVESGYNALREGYQGLDRNFFGGYLPGGAKNDDPETQRWDNPMDPLKQSLDHFGNTLRNDQRQTDSADAWMDPEGPVNNSSPKAEALFTDMVVDGKVYTAEELQDIKQNPTPGQEAHSNLDALARYAESMGIDMDSPPSKGSRGDTGSQGNPGQNAISDDPKTFSKLVGTNASYTDSNNNLVVADWFTTARPDKIDFELEYKSVEGYETYYKKGTDIPFEYTREFGEMYGSLNDNQVTEFFNDMSGSEKGDWYKGNENHRMRFDNANYSPNHANSPWQHRDIFKNASASATTDAEYLNNLKAGWGDGGEGWKAMLRDFAGMKEQTKGKYGHHTRMFGMYPNTIAEGLAEGGSLGVTYNKGSSTPTNQEAQGRQFTGIDLNPLEGFQREIGRQGMSIGGGTGFTDSSTGFRDDNFGDYRILL